MGSLVWICLIVSILSRVEYGALAEEKGDKADVATENGVYVLTDGNFDGFLELHKDSGILIEFYAPWCGHCKALTPEYEKAAKLLSESKLKVPLAKVDATVEVKVAQKYSIQGYPTLKFWRNGEPSDYDGPRDAEGIVNWIREKADPNYKPPPEAVLTLGKDNFTKIALSAPIIVVEFYAPWCGHCKKLAPEYEKAAQRLKHNDPPILLAKVDATIEKDLSTEYQVTGFPTMKIFRNGRRFEYSGPREADGIVAYMKEQARPASHEWKSVREAQKGLSQKDVSIIGFFDSEDSELLDNFKDAAEAMREDFSVFAYTFDPKVIEHFKVSAGQIVVYFPERFWSKYEKKSKVLEKPKASREDITAFVYDNCVPLVGQRTQANDGRRYFKKRPLVVGYYTVDFSPAHREGTQYWRQKMLNVAKDYPAYSFAIADEDEFNKEIQDFGLGESALDVNIIVFGKDNKRYVMDPEKYDEFDEDNFRAFMKNLNEGRIKPYIKSQPAPKGDKGPVKTVVASTFDSIVKDESKDVLIEFYAPWCGHCKQLEPVLKDLALKVKSDPNLVIAKLDATANDAPQEYKVEGFPTIYFAPAGKKDAPIKYASGNRAVSDFMKFMKENAVASFAKTEL